MNSSYSGKSDRPTRNLATGSIIYDRSKKFSAQLQHVNEWKNGDIRFVWGLDYFLTSLIQEERYFLIKIILISAIIMGMENLDLPIYLMIKMIIPGMMMEKGIQDGIQMICYNFQHP